MYQETGFKKICNNPERKPLSVISSIGDIMTRIKGAELYSPIAVFTKRQPSPIKGFGLVAVFGSTFETKKIANNKNKNFIGMFSKNDDLKSIVLILNRVLVV